MSPPDYARCYYSHAVTTLSWQQRQIAYTLSSLAAGWVLKYHTILVVDRAYLESEDKDESRYDFEEHSLYFLFYG